MKQIIVPKDKQAIKDLEYNIVEDEQLLIWYLTDNEYLELDELEVFDLLNKECNCLIDNFEDDMVNYDKLLKVNNLLSSKNNPLINKLNVMISEAIKRGTSIHFYF